MMYESFYGLRERPFDLTADPKFLHFTSKHREALYTLRYGISGGKGVTMLVGEAGTGKTTLLHKALDEESKDNRSIVCVKNPTLTRHEFFEFLTNGFGLHKSAARSKSRFLVAFEEQLLARHEAGGLNALIVDEAQALSNELLEELRLLANLETSTDKLLAVILVGQPELAERLNHPSLRQLKQRVALRSTLSPLDLQETAAYIAARIRIAGGDGQRMFTREAVIAIYERSGGIPRTISVICDNALITGFASELRPVGQAAVLEACRDLELDRLLTVTVKPRRKKATPRSGTNATRDASPSIRDHRAQEKGDDSADTAIVGLSAPDQSSDAPIDRTTPATPNESEPSPSRSPRWQGFTAFGTRGT